MSHMTYGNLLRGVLRDASGQRPWLTWVVVAWGSPCGLPAGSRCAERTSLAKGSNVGRRTGKPWHETVRGYQKRR
jgi:hypothetical protein